MLFVKFYSVAVWSGFSAIFLLIVVSNSAHAQFETIINIPEDQPSIGGAIGSDTQLNVHDGGIVESFFDAGDVNGGSSNTEVNIFGGSVGTRFDSFNSAINIFDGEIGDSFDARSGSVVQISGGQFGFNFDASDSKVTISGGTFDGNFDVCNSTVNISGGEFGTGFFVLPNTIINISGGSIGDDFRAFPISQVFFYGDDFTIDGEPIAGLVPGETTEIKTRGGAILAGNLFEGSSFSFQLNDIFVEGQDFVSDLSVVSVTILDQILIGDVNRDGTIDLLDVGPFIDLLIADAQYQVEADINQDGRVDLLDIAPLIDLLAG